MDDVVSIDTRAAATTGVALLAALPVGLLPRLPVPRVALTGIAVRNGTMTTQDAAAPVGTGMVTVLVLPAQVVTLLHRPQQPAPARPPARPAGPTR